MNPKALIKLLKNCGFPIEFIAKFKTFKHAEPFIKSLMRQIPALIHEDKIETPVYFSQIYPKIALIKEEGAGRVYHTCKDFAKESLSGLEDFPDQDKPSELQIKNLESFVLGQYWDKLRGISSNKYLLIHSPNPNLYENAFFLNIPTLFKNNFFIESVEEENRIRKNDLTKDYSDSIKNLENEIEGLNEKKDHLIERNRNVSELVLKLKIKKENEIEEILGQNYISVRDFLFENFDEEIKNLIIQWETYSIEFGDKFGKHFIKKRLYNDKDIEEKNGERSKHGLLRTMINERLLKSLKDYSEDIKDEFIDARQMLIRFCNHFYGEVETNIGDLLDNEGEKIINRNKNKINNIEKNLDGFNSQIDAEKRKINDFENFEPIELFLNKKSKPITLFKFYYSQLNITDKKYFLGRQLIDTDPVSFDPLTLLKIDNNGHIFFQNIEQIENTAFLSKNFEETNRRIVAVLNLNKYERHMVEKENMNRFRIKGKIESQEGYISPVNILESEVYTSFTTDLMTSNSLLSAEETKNGLIYRIEGKVASNFFENILEPDLLDSSKTFRYVKPLKE